MTHCDDALQYADSVISGEIAACHWVKRACSRFVSDMERVGTDDFPYVYCVKSADGICDFIELLQHIKGEWAGKALLLEPWQKFILCNVFGWKLGTVDGPRRFRTVYIEVPRKNAKSTLTSGVALYMLAADGEGGAEIYSAATTREQAKIVFNDAQTMTRKSPDLCNALGISVHAHNIAVFSTASKFEALSAEGGTLDGLNVHFAAIDELHAHKTRGVFDVIETATGSRKQSIIWNITTAGSNLSGICYEQRSYSTKILDNVTEDESYFCIIYTIDDDDDWLDPEIWGKANPNYGVSIYPDDLARLAKKAAEMPSAQNNFLTKRLNVWVNADTAWMNMLAWNKCADTSLQMEDFLGERCFVGIDLASRKDIAAVTILFRVDGIYYVFGWYYLAKLAVEVSPNSQYPGWANTEELIVTPGAETDFAYIENDIQKLAKDYQIEEIAYDTMQAGYFASRMVDQGFVMVEFNKTVKNFSEPMKHVEVLILGDKLKHNGSPVLTWMMSNVVCHIDKKDNIFPNKATFENKIDGVDSLITAMGRAMLHKEKPPGNDGSMI